MQAWSVPQLRLLTQGRALASAPSVQAPGTLIIWQASSSFPFLTGAPLSLWKFPLGEEPRVSTVIYGAPTTDQALAVPALMGSFPLPPVLQVRKLRLREGEQRPQNMQLRSTGPRT